jgi:hypothetical protein
LPHLAHAGTMPRMNSIGRFVVAVTVALGLGACRVQEPVAPSLEVPRDGAQVCASHCATMGLALGSFERDKGFEPSTFSLGS